MTWEEVERGIRIEDFTIKNVPARVEKLGDLWKPLLSARGRSDLGRFVYEPRSAAGPSSRARHRAGGTYLAGREVATRRMAPWKRLGAMQR